MLGSAREKKARRRVNGEKMQLKSLDRGLCSPLYSAKFFFTAATALIAKIKVIELNLKVIEIGDNISAVWSGVTCKFFTSEYTYIHTGRRQ